MPKRHVPDELTPTEAAVEGMLRRDPIRQLTDQELERRLWDCRDMRRLFAGTGEAHRCEELWFWERRILDEQRRRAAA